MTEFTRVQAIHDHRTSLAWEHYLNIDGEMMSNLSKLALGGAQKHVLRTNPCLEGAEVTGLLFSHKPSELISQSSILGQCLDTWYSIFLFKK